MPKTPTNTKPRTSSGYPPSPAGPTFRPTPFPPLPDVIVHHTAKNWLLLIEAVTSAGPVDGRLELGWKARTQAELALMADLHHCPTKRAQGRDISGLSAYEQ